MCAGNLGARRGFRRFLRAAVSQVETSMRRPHRSGNLPGVGRTSRRSAANLLNLFICQFAVVVQEKGSLL